MIYFELINDKISYLKSCKTAQFWFGIGSLATSLYVLKWLTYYYCQRSRVSMTSFPLWTRKTGCKLSPQSQNSSMIFHSNQEICIRFHDNGVYFVLATGLCINLSGTVTPSQIIRPSSLWKLQLVGPSSSCFIVLPSFSRLDFFQVKNYATRTR